MNKLSLLSAALVAAAAAYPQDAGGPTPPRVTVEPVGPTPPRVTVKPVGPTTPSVTVLAQDPVGSTPHRFTVEITSQGDNAPQDGGLQRQSGVSDSTNASGIRIGSPPGSGSTSAALPRRFTADRTHEVELVILPTKSEGNSPAVLARWSELAAKGYTIEKVIAVGDHIYMFMQREATTENQHVTLPEVVEKDASLAESVRVKIVKWNETTRASPQPVKQIMPPQRPAPVQPAQADPENPPTTGF